MFLEICEISLSKTEKQAYFVAVKISSVLRFCEVHITHINLTVVRRQSAPSVHEMDKYM